MKHYKKLTDKDYALIKEMLSSGISGSKIRRLTNRGAGTIVTIKRTNTFREYQEAVKAANEHFRKQPVDSSVSPEVDVEPTITVSSNETLVQLTRIANSLERLVDAWEKPNKKGWIR